MIIDDNPQGRAEDRAAARAAVREGRRQFYRDQVTATKQAQAVKVEAGRAARLERRGGWAKKLKTEREADPMAWTKTYDYARPDTLPTPPPPPVPTGGEIVPAGYWDGLEKVVGRAGSGGAMLLERADLFDELLGLSLQRALDIMRIDIKDMQPDDKNFQKIMSTQQSVMSSVFSTAARIDEAKLRAQETDKLDEVLEALHREERGGRPAPPVIDAEFIEAPAQGTRSEADILAELMG